jgi:hypothetical protein
MMYRWQPAAVGNEPSVLPLRNLWFARSDRFFSHFKREIPARLLYCIERRSACYDLYFYAIPLSYRILPVTNIDRRSALSTEPPPNLEIHSELCLSFLKDPRPTSIIAV